MTGKEFMQWQKDFAVRFPDVGIWMNANPQTMKIWLSDVFYRLFLDDCLKVNGLLLSERTERFDRERLPALIAKMAIDIRYERTEAEKSKAHEAKQYAEKKYQTPFDSGMTAAFDAMTAYQVEFNEQNGRPVTDSERTAFVDKWFDENDHSDPYSDPRYLCLRCVDTGLVSYRDEKGRYTCGHCDCEKGISERDRYFNARKPGRASGMTVGPARRD